MPSTPCSLALSRMSILCCCRNRHADGKNTHPDAIELPIQPPRARLSKTLSPSDTDMYLSSILASRGPSRLITPTYHNIVDLEDVEVDDSDDDVPERDTREPGMGKIGSFKTKLIRRLSHRVDNKAGSQPSVGTSNEELARRAELRRLMHKRIQEELKSEEEEDDLRLPSPKQPSIINCREPELPGGGPRDTIEFSVSGIEELETGTIPETPILPPPVINGPQDLCRRRSSCPESIKKFINNSSNDCNISLKDMGSGTQPPSPSHPIPVHLLGECCESPSPASWRLSYNAGHLDSCIEPLKEAKQASHPQSPEPKDSSSNHDGDTTNRQRADTINCSNITTQDETIATSQTIYVEQVEDTEEKHKDHEISTYSDEINDGRYSPLDIWLRSQELHCTSILSSRPNSEMALEHLHEADAQVRQIVELQQFDNSTDLSRHKDQTVDSVSVSQLNAPGAWPKSPEDSSGAAKPPIAAASNESIALHQILSQMENALTPEAQSIEDQVQDVSSRYTSSRYTTRPNSQQATPRDSRPSFIEQLGNRRILQPLPPIYGPVSPYRLTTSHNSDTSSYRTALNKISSSDHVRANPESSKFPTTQALPTSASETASFRQREEELKSIKKRFGLTPARRYPIVAVRSKFREEFEGSKSSNSARSSILSKFHLVSLRRARTPSSHTASNKKNNGEIKIFSTDFRKPRKAQSSSVSSISSGLNSNRGDGLPSNIVPKPHLEERATSLWQRAIQQESDNRAGRIKTKLTKVSNTKTYLNGAEGRPVLMRNQSSCRADSPKAHAADDERECPVEECAPLSQNPGGVMKLNDAEAKDPVDMQSGVLQEWVEQLQAEDAQRQSRPGSRITVPKQQPPRLRTPPESWAKWPSHTREERTTSAGEKDKVNTRDFAVVLNSNPFEAEASGKTLPKGREQTASSRTLSSQVSKVLKSGWNKMIVHKGSIGRVSGHMPTTQNIEKPQEFLEYPELELLPTAQGFKEVQALEQQIDTMKRRSTSGRRMIAQHSSDTSQRQLSARIAEEVHKIKLEGDNIPWTGAKCRAGRPLGSQFLTPAHALLIPRSKSCAGEIFGTAQSHYSYEDCVQTQMLDDDDDEADTTKSQDMPKLKRAKSTGNIEIKLPSSALLVDNAHSNRGPIHRTWRSGLRKQKSLGWVRGNGGGQDKPTEA
ncbi:hypothetical protein HD806DRAFT_347592 [Xylariaceae sp. AK1471]|nr:hypothetical protein HD806DRAFT_347592 [Xylariaceae sp. AK1471]